MKDIMKTLGLLLATQIAMVFIDKIKQGVDSIVNPRIQPQDLHKEYTNVLCKHCGGVTYKRHNFLICERC